MRLIYQPNARVKRTEPVFGPAMLADSVTKQVSNWTLKTNAVGDEECMSLIIAEFRFRDPDEPSRPQREEPSAPGILRASVESQVLIISDPGEEISTGNPFKVFAHRMKTLAKHLSHRPN